MIMPRTKLLLAPEDLVLHLNKKAREFDLEKYQDFLYELCGDWEFQKEAVETALRFYLSGIYGTTKQLLEENYANNPTMQGYASLNEMTHQLSFPDKLSCTIDLATGTGKTWVMYAVARILLAEGTVDRVLILCPSTTIKNQLYRRFIEFSENAILTNALPKKSVIRIPSVKHSDETIETGDICIDNVHRTYDHVSSSIADSLRGKGQKTLVINDEAHHLLNPSAAGENQTMAEWQKFLVDPKFNFRYILNVSGTPYKGDQYFLDVVYRFSIRQAINKAFIKDIRYLEKDGSRDWKDKWKSILSNHEKLQKKYPQSDKHITIIITNSIQSANALEKEVKGVLEKNKKLTPSEADKKVLVVTSSPQHQKNRKLLETVDRKENPVEWIISVSMLTEGWDVANVFQIVPHDSRAFNSKLLISQVLGRGLRIPRQYQNGEIQPQVWVYNHTAWSPKIDHLVNELAELNSEFHSIPDPKSCYNFEVHYFDVEKEIKSSKKVERKETPAPPKSLGFSSTVTHVTQTYREVGRNTRSDITTKVADDIVWYSVDEATNAVYTTLLLFDWERKTKICERVTKKYIGDLIQKELKVIREEKVSEENLQRAKAAFNVLTRQYVGVSKIEDVYGQLQLRKTAEMQVSKITEIAFRHYGGLLSTKENIKKFSVEDKDILDKIKRDLQAIRQTTLTGAEYTKARIIDDLDADNYRCPLNFIILSHRPEREFAELVVRKYIKYIDAWVKAPNRGFYEVPYIYRPGTHSLQRDFNPDFFIKIDKRIIVVEIKAEDDTTVQNKDKLEGATAYFKTLNEKLNGKGIYEFYFLEPTEYTMFFEKVIVKGEHFVGGLQAELASKSREQLKTERVVPSR